MSELFDFQQKGHVSTHYTDCFYYEFFHEKFLGITQYTSASSAYFTKSGRLYFSAFGVSFGFGWPKSVFNHNG